MTTISRRTFLQSAAAVGAGAALFNLTGPTVQGQVVGANNRVRMALAGCGGRGRGVANDNFARMEGVQFVAVVDANRNQTTQAANLLYENHNHRPAVFQDYRLMLEDNSIDAVLIASTNHWHALQTVWGCMAGKHIYVEKPGSYNIFESRQVINAAAKYNRRVQLGTQRRSDNDWTRCAAAAKSGKYGKLIAAKAFANRGRGRFRQSNIIPPPEHLDWEQWLGPAQPMPFYENLLNGNDTGSGNWHWFWEPGNGEIGNNGPHFFDLCLWGMDEPRNPDSVVSFGARIQNDNGNIIGDQAQTPSVHFAFYEFGDVPVIFESCNVDSGNRDVWTRREETEFFTEAGSIRGQYFIAHDGTRERIDVEFTRPNPNNISGPEFVNFINAVRDPSVPLNAPVDKGIYCANMAHWGNAAYRSGTRTTLATCREKIGNNPIMQSTIDGVLANLRAAFGNDVDLETAIPWQCSDRLEIDIVNERFTNSRAGNQFLKRIPREPFVMPEVSASQQDTERPIRRVIQRLRHRLRSRRLL